MRDFLDRTYGILARHPWWTLGLLLAAHTAWTMDCRALWFSDEVRYANAFENVVRAGKWLVLSLNGQPYPDKPPLYFWFLALLHTISRMPAVFFLGAALSGLAYLFATLGLTWNPEGTVNRQYAVFTLYPYSGGCDICYLQESCPKAALER
jgi:4-amino-4-deoxy-L-arabinose transferase-like glycosyltransferase